MRAPNDTLTRHNFFTNKFDTTAWYNNYLALPVLIFNGASCNQSCSDSILFPVFLRTKCRNDFDAIPRSVSSTGLNDHNGSRNRLMFIRREVAREHGDSKMEIAVNSIPKINTKRSNLITNVSVENN